MQKFEKDNAPLKTLASAPYFRRFGNTGCIVNNAFEESNSALSLKFSKIIIRQKKKQLWACVPTSTCRFGCRFKACMER